MINAESAAVESSGKGVVDAKTKISSLLKDKEKEWTAVVEKKGPLRLLDLPMDVLKEIVKEVSSLGLTRIHRAHVGQLADSSLLR